MIRDNVIRDNVIITSKSSSKASTASILRTLVGTVTFCGCFTLLPSYSSGLQ